MGDVMQIMREIITASGRKAKVLETIPDMTADERTQAITAACIKLEAAGLPGYIDTKKCTSQAS